LQTFASLWPVDEDRIRAATDLAWHRDAADQVAEDA
jgi:hypothetical protein